MAEFLVGRLIGRTIRHARRNQPWENKGRFGHVALHRRLLKRLAYLKDRVYNPFSARANVAHHYDIGNELYRLRRCASGTPAA